jgi:hypothetical protein
MVGASKDPNTNVPYVYMNDYSGLDQIYDNRIVNGFSAAELGDIPFHWLMNRPCRIVFPNVTSEYARISVNPINVNGAEYTKITFAFYENVDLSPYAEGTNAVPEFATHTNVRALEFTLENSYSNVLAYETIYSVLAYQREFYLVDGITYESQDNKTLTITSASTNN